MNKMRETKAVKVVSGLWLLVISATLWGADDAFQHDSLQFNAEQYFDFSSQDQLQAFTPFGEDPSYIEDGRLICPIAAGTHKGVGKLYPLEKDGHFTNEVSMSFDIFLDENFQLNTHPSEVGKFPGFEGIYDLSAGWGGKPVGTENSWSIRIGHLQQDSNGKVPIGLYIYHPNMTSQYGTAVPANFSLQTMTTYRVTLYVKLNDVGASNGVIALLVDGEQKYFSDAWTLRLSDSVHVKSAWLNAYIGGATPSPVDTWIALDNLDIKWNQCTAGGCGDTSPEKPALPPPPQDITATVID